MAKEKLPIKFFAKREVDNLRVEGGGTSKPPKWVITEPELLEYKSNEFITVLDSFKEKLKMRENSSVPVVFKAKLNENAKAKSHRGKVNELFRKNKRDESNIIGLIRDDEVIVKLNDMQQTIDIIGKIKNVKKNFFALSCIEKIEEFEPFIEMNKDIDFADYKIKLIDFQDEIQNKIVRNFFEKSLNELGLNFKKTNYSKDLLIYNVHLVSLDDFKKIYDEECFSSIFSIEPMPKYTVKLDFVEDSNEISILLPEEGKRYEVVGILDNGISDIPQLQPWIVDEKYSSYPDEYIKKDHGTFVSGIVVYGDDLEGKEWVGTNGVKLLDACIFPDSNKETIGEDELISNIKEAIEMYHDKVKIWNLSISIVNETDEFKFSDFAIALDKLQDQYGILICKSVGNCCNYLRNEKPGRLHQGADSVRSIVVGSIAHKKSTYDLAEVDNHSPFSRIGRGPSYIIKPELVHYGGNAGINSDGKYSQTGVKSFSVDGGITQAIGTSFSTPRISSLAAGLLQEMSEEFDPLLIKSLMIHSAEYSKKLTIKNEDRVNKIGFGRPNSVKEILYNSPNEVTLILRDEMLKGEYIDIMDFPMPDCLIDQELFFGQIVVTLVYDPILAPYQGDEYCQSDIEVSMGTYEKKKDRDTSRPNILNPIGRDNSMNVLLRSNYSKTKIKKNIDDFALTERVLIQYGDKYYPVKKYGVNLSEITDGNKNKFLQKDRNWFLKLRGIYRDFIENKSAINQEIPSQKFCLVITIKDPTGTRPVYDQMTQKLNEHNFIHENIKINEEISVYN